MFVNNAGLKNLNSEGADHPRSTGQCEGHICRVKLIKRIEYGRAKPVLLRQRVFDRCAA